MFCKRGSEGASRILVASEYAVQLDALFWERFGCSWGVPGVERFLPLFSGSGSCLVFRLPRGLRPWND